MVDFSLDDKKIAASVIQDSHAAIISTTLDGTIIGWNSGATDLYGYTREEAKEQDITLIDPQGFRGDFLLTQLKAQYTLQHKRNRKDGTLIWVTLSISPLKDDQDNVVGVVEISMDITSLEKEKDQLLQALVNSPIAEITLDSRGNVVLVNKKVLELFGYHEGELEGKTIEILIPERFKTKYSTSRQEFIKRPLVRSVGIDHDLFGRRKNGEEFPLEIYLTPLQTTDELLVIATVVDLTERKNSELLSRSNRELEQFAYLASHDLQAPLRHIASYVQLLAAKYINSNDAETEKWINFILQSSEKMQLLISDLLKYSRVTQSKLKMELTNVHDIISNVKEILKDMILNTGAQIIEEDLPVLFCSSMYLEQIFLNLIENAIKFRKDNVAPIIIIHSKPIEGGYEISVKDNGIGIPHQFFDKVFQLFQRLEQKKGVNGTGVGLAIVKRIVELHHGRIWLESKENEGCTFHFTISEAQLSDATTQQANVISSKSSNDFTTPKTYI